MTIIFQQQNQTLPPPSVASRLLRSQLVALNIFISQFPPTPPHFSFANDAHGTMGHRFDHSSDQSYIVNPLSYSSFQPVLHDWCNKGLGMCYPVYGIVHIKEPLLLIEKRSTCSGGSRIPLSLSESSFTIIMSDVI